MYLNLTLKEEGLYLQEYKMKSNKKLESIRHFFCLSRKRKKVTSHVAFCVGWCWRWRGSSQEKEREMWWYFSFVPTIVSFFSPACDVEPSCLLCSPTFYSFSVAPFFLIFHFLQCWPHNLNLSFLHSSFHCHISVSWKHTHTRMHTHSHAPISPGMLFDFLTLLPWVCIHHIWIECILISVYKWLYMQLVNAGSGTMNVSFFKYVCEIVRIQACQ